jgi:hypothetical protein
MNIPEKAYSQNNSATAMPVRQVAGRLRSIVPFNLRFSPSSIDEEISDAVSSRADKNVRQMFAIFQTDKNVYPAVARNAHKNVIQEFVVTPQQAACGFAWRIHQHKLPI